jgi:hypothetical protein
MLGPLPGLYGRWAAPDNVKDQPLSDIFTEVEEEVRRERLEQLWKQYGDYLIAGAALIVIAVAGWQIYDRYATNQRLKASETLIAAQAISEAGAADRANAVLAPIAKDSMVLGGYPEMARMTEAGTLLASGKRDEAVEIYKAIAAKDSGPVGQAALVRAAWAVSDTASKQDLETLLAPVNTATSPWRYSAREILAFADYQAHDFKAAEAEFRTLGNDKDAPEGLQRRATAMADFVKGGGEANYGTVPQPPPLAPPAGAAPAAPPATNGTPSK